MKLSMLIAAALLAAGAPAFAQAPAGKDGDASARQQQRMERMKERCAKAQDPKACEARFARAKERRARAHEAHAKAREACQGQQGDAQRDCMRRQMCAQAKDPAKCEAQAKAGAERRAKAHAACRDKSGPERRACLREQMGRSS